MTTEKWIPTYSKNGSSTQYEFTDGSWVCFMKGIYDDRDIMSDCVKPSWSSSGEFLVELIPSGYRHNSDADFKAYVNKDWANTIFYNLTHGRFNTMRDLKEALRLEGKKVDKYIRICGHESVRLGLS